ncbi:hypothetical protein AYK25_05215 [Thermoplasmatales archaeon SM1-50]|nr:MAG: hypothetical protein AYK25_05215 [Thermoplasmatales archaeon SM1-50]
MKKRIIDDPYVVTKLDENENASVLREVRPLFEKEEALLEINDGSIIFIGDLHGDFTTVIAIIRRFFRYDHLVFLGDYIDREPVKWGSIHTILYLFLLKCCFPEKIILLKGNHECHSFIPCCPYEFEDEILQRFGSTEFHQRVVEVFSEMPLMVLAQKVFAVHGGIVKGATLEYLKKLKKNDVTALVSLVWGDPVISHTNRGIGNPFDENELLNFLDIVHANVLVRGHDYNTLGFSIYDDRCLTIFSSQGYKDMGNGGILVACAEKKIPMSQNWLLKIFTRDDGEDIRSQSYEAKECFVCDSETFSDTSPL